MERMVFTVKETWMIALKEHVIMVENVWTKLGAMSVNANQDTLDHDVKEMSTNV